MNMITWTVHLQMWKRYQLTSTTQLPRVNSMPKSAIYHITLKSVSVCNPKKRNVRSFNVATTWRAARSRCVQEATYLLVAYLGFLITQTLTWDCADTCQRCTERYETSVKDQNKFKDTENKYWKHKICYSMHTPYGCNSCCLNISVINIQHRNTEAAFTLSVNCTKKVESFIFRKQVFFFFFLKIATARLARLKNWAKFNLMKMSSDAKQQPLEDGLIWLNTELSRKTTTLNKYIFK